MNNAIFFKEKRLLFRPILFLKCKTRCCFLNYVSILCTMQICVCLRSWYRAGLMMESGNVAHPGTRSSDIPRQSLFNPTIANHSPVMTLNDSDT